MKRRLQLALGSLALAACATSFGSDHLDTRTVIEDPRADIGDLYAWISPESQRLNLAMTLVGHTFSEELRYEFHIDSGAEFGRTTSSTTITCRVVKNIAECDAGGIDSARGDATDEHGIESHNRHFRLFAGLRDDPFFNNVKGTRDAYQKVAAGLRAGASIDESGCPRLDHSTSEAVLNEWQHTDGGPATNFLKGWTPASIVISIDLALVNRGGNLLAVWGTTSSSHEQMDRMGRPLIGNALLAPLAPDDVSDALKEKYNRSTPATSEIFVDEIAKTLGLYDGFDGRCGNQLLADKAATGLDRYRPMAKILADDRLWVNADAKVCTQFFGVELDALAGYTSLRHDCGGRTPTYDAVDVYRSLLATGETLGVDDGVDRDEKDHSDTRFPFLAAP